MKADLFSGLAEPDENPVCQKGDYSMVRLSEDAETGAERIVDCELCVSNSPVHEFGRVCCRVRFIMHEPRLEVRRMWIERWKWRDGVIGENVEKEVLARWANER